MADVPILDILENIKTGKYVSRKKLYPKLKDSRYCQGCLDILEELEYINIIKDGVSKYHELTPKGEKLLNGKSNGKK